MANHWILKTDSEVYPFDQLERDRRTVWDGVSNAVALKHIRSMLTVVDIEVDRRLPRTVSLAAIKAEPSFADLGLVRTPRLSVMPASPAQWKKLLTMAGA
jgi:predicted RNA-binding protein with PUA-like domain